MICVAALALTYCPPVAPPGLTPFGEFGALTEPKTQYKCEWSKADGLTLTAPDTHPAVVQRKNTLPAPPVSRTVEGDFVATVRVKFSLPENAERRSGSDDEPAIGVALTTFVDGYTRHAVSAVVLHTREGKKWVGDEFFWRRFPKDDHTWMRCGAADAPGAPVYLKVVREDDWLDAHFSSDGKKWRWAHGNLTRNLPDSLAVGPAVFHCTDQAFTATFDQYEIKLLKKDEKK